jgi:hypothetical protein
VRGIGVAVITRTSGEGPWLAVARCSTPRCCRRSQPGCLKPRHPDERVGADGEVHNARFHFRQLTPANRRAMAPVSKATDGAGLEQSRDVQEMLFREDLGGRHEGHRTVLHGHERRQQRHGCLAGAHVALQQSVHRMSRRSSTISSMTPSAPPSAEGQHPPRRFANPIVHTDLNRLAPPEIAAARARRGGRGRPLRKSTGAAGSGSGSAPRSAPSAENAPPGTWPGKGDRDACATRRKSIGRSKAGAAARRTSLR